MLRYLLAPARKIEPRQAGALFHPFEALALLSSLGDLTERSFAPLAPASPASPVFETLPDPAAESPEAVDVRYETAKREYRPALNDQSIIEALLELQQAARPASSAKRSSAPKNSIKTPGVEHTPSFSAEALPKVQAQLKQSTLSNRKALGVFHPILRPEPAN